MSKQLLFNKQLQLNLVLLILTELSKQIDWAIQIRRKYNEFLSTLIGNMPKTYITFIDGKNLYTCKKCQSHLVSLGQLVSKAFKGRTGAAYLFNTVQNIKLGEQRDQSMLTGLHRVSSVFCGVCDNNVAIGWKYIKAYEPSQKYKEGRYILERYYLKKENWEQDDYDGESS